MSVGTRFLTAALAGLLLGLGGAWTAGNATSFSTAQVTRENALLTQFNVVVTGAWNDTTATSSAQHYVDGRVIAGSANLAYNGACTNANCLSTGTKPIDATGVSYGALTVFGNITGTYGTGAGNTSVGGNATGILFQNNTGTLNLAKSGSGLAVYSPGTAVSTSASSFQGSLNNNATGVTPKANVALTTTFPFGSSVINTLDLAKGLAALPGSPGVTAQTVPTANNLFFTAAADYTLAGTTYGVFTSTVANLANFANFQGNGTNAATFVIITDSGNLTLPNLNSFTDASKVIFDFVNATSLSFSGAGNFNGTILAPLATLNQNASGVLNGSIVVANLNQTAAITDSNMFTGNITGLVPEPASLTVFGVGIAAAALLRRRRGRKG